ncbi:hypothetical protein E1267_17130 [Nonomuraea longispora]|uniref:Uncharacterized protein n=1 Tax=Nonomuraea longispora TaxID=1848320 RepID=A0A4R4NG11_9ACTN|nr:hypothetical protein E1267_17130 [Nonomuraea longispora]
MSVAFSATSDTGDVRGHDASVRDEGDRAGRSGGQAGSAAWSPGCRRTDDRGEMERAFEVSDKKLDDVVKVLIMFA